MKIKVIQYSNRQSIINITNPIILNYCKKHEYEYQLIPQETLKATNGHHHAWTKFLAMLSEIDMHSDVDWLVWVDDDILIMDKTISLEMFTTQDYDKIFVGAMFNDTAELCVHSGIFGLRNCLESLVMMNNFYLDKRFYIKKYDCLIGEEVALGKLYTDTCWGPKMQLDVPVSKLFTYPYDVEVYRSILESMKTYYKDVHHFRQGDFFIHPMLLDINAKEEILKKYAKSNRE
jgi:hypothetical protein